MSNARIQFSLASEDVWKAYNPQLKEGEIVTVLKANKKVKLVQGKVGGSTYSESTVIWDEDEAQIIMSRSEAAAVTATAQAAAAKNYSENVNVFLPSVSSDGVLEWTNKAGLTNPPAVNIKGATGAAATIEIGTVSTGAAGSNASVVNRGTANNAVFDFTLPRGADGGVTVDAALSDTSINPVQNKVVKAAIDSVAASVPTKVSDLPNDAGYLTQHQSLADYAKTSVANTWTAAQTLNFLSVYYEKYPIYIVTGTNDTPLTSAMMYKATNNFTLDLDALAMKVDKSQISVFSAYFTADADYALTITNCGTVKYIGSASDVAITSSGLLLNIMMVKDASNNLTSIVQANKLS